MNKISRRKFIEKSTTGAIASTTLPLASSGKAQSSYSNSLLEYPEEMVTTASELKIGEPVYFNYPDTASPCAMVRLNRPVSFGAGPGEDIVAFSLLCPHMGCTLLYQSDDNTFKCRCHFSMFDAEIMGQLICGQATQSLPRIELEYLPDSDAIRAVSIQGNLFGRTSNILQG